MMGSQKVIAVLFILEERVPQYNDMMGPEMTGPRQVVEVLSFLKDRVPNTIATVRSRDDGITEGARSTVNPEG